MYAGPGPLPSPEIWRSRNPKQFVIMRALPANFLRCQGIEHALRSPAPSSGTTNFEAPIGLGRATPPRVPQSTPHWVHSLLLSPAPPPHVTSILLSSSVFPGAALARQTHLPLPLIGWSGPARAGSRPSPPPPKPSHASPHPWPLPPLSSGLPSSRPSHCSPCGRVLTVTVAPAGTAVRTSQDHSTCSPVTR